MERLRATALLRPEATPVRLVSTEASIAVVSGATAAPIPSETARTAGNLVAQ